MSNALLLQAQMLADNEKYEEAYDLLVNSYDKYKTDAEYLEKTALMAKTLEKNDEAAKYWEELVAVDSNSVIGYSELLDIYFNTNKFKYYITRAKYNILNEKISYAISDYKKAIGSTTEPAEIINARFLMAKAYEFKNQTQEAIDEYHRILEQKDDPAIYYKLADLYAQTGDRYSAINVIEKALQLYPEMNDLHEYVAALYMKEGQYDKSVEHAKSVFTQAKSLLMKGDNEKAFELLSTVEDKTNANYPALMAEYYFNKKDWENCNKYIEDFRALANQNPLVYQMKALVCDATGDNYGYHYNMGRCYSFRQEYDLALAEYLNAHRTDASQSGAIKEIIKINESSGDKTSLMEFYEKLVRQEPDNPVALKGLGDVYADMYEFSQAADYYEKAVKVNPNDYEAYAKLGFLFEKQKNTGKALKAYEKYLEKAPLSPDSEKIKEKVEKMRGQSTGESLDNDEGFIYKIMRIFGK